MATENVIGRHTRPTSILSLTILLCCASAGPCLGEEDVEKLKPKEFSQWVERTLKPNTDIATGHRMRDMLVRRVTAGLDVYDSTVKRIVQSFAGAEFLSKHDKELKRTAPDVYGESIAFVRALRPLFPQRPLLLSWLHHIEGTWLQSEDSREEAAGQFAAARRIHDSLRVELGAEFVENLVKLGGQNHLLGKKAATDEAYLEVLCFQFFLLGDEMNAMPETEQMEFSRRFASSYKFAVEGLIKTRYGNAERLRDLKRRVITGFKSMFDEKIDALIKEAEADSAKRPK